MRVPEQLMRAMAAEAEAARNARAKVNLIPGDVGCDGHGDDDNHCGGHEGEEGMARICINI